MLPVLVVDALSSVAPTRDELRSIASASRHKVPGSSNSLKTWRFWSDKTLQLIQSDLRESLPVAVDKQALKELSFQLGVAADIGAMPSFENEGARAGYAVNYFCRAQLMADLLFSSDSPILVETIDDLLGGRSICRIGSLGGGPGYDFVAAALLASYRSEQRGQLPTNLQVTIFDYEEGWDSLVDAMAGSVQTVLGGSHSCGFCTCDITVPFSDPVNTQCRLQMKDTDIWFCSYCVAENAKKLRAGEYVFFRELFSQAKEGAVFVFTETTHRLWPELARAAPENGFDMSFPSRFQKQLGKRQMVLRKREGATIGEEELALCAMFDRDNDLHEQKIQNGIVRQIRKVRGAK